MNWYTAMANEKTALQNAHNRLVQSLTALVERWEDYCKQAESIDDYDAAQAFMLCAKQAKQLLKGE